MTGVLKPGVRLLERFSYARKFQLLFLLFVLPLGYALWIITSTYLDRLETVDRELGGMRVVQALGGVQRELLAQQLLLARWKGTEKEAQALLEKRAGELDQALQRAAEVLKAESLGEHADQHFATLQALRSQVSVAEVGRQALPDALERYQKVLLQLLALREQVATDSGLILDPWLDTYLMMELLTDTLPHQFEQLGAFASNGHGAVLSQHFTLQSRVLIRDLRRALEESRASLRKVQATLSKEAPRVAEALQQPSGKAMQGLDEFLARVDRDMFEANPMALTTADFVQAVTKVEDELHGFEDALHAEFERRLGVYRGRALSSMLEVMGAFGLLTLLALYVLFCLNAAIRRSTASITAVAEGLRAGDLRVHAEAHGQDEMAVIAEALNAAVEQLRDSLQGVSQETQQLGDTVLILNGQAQDALLEVEQQQGQVSQIATAATEMAATAQSVAESCEEAASEAGQTREIAMQSNQRSARTSASMRELSARLGDTASTLQQLREQTQQINRIVDVIKGIAEQTNLLALNAAIEAARAGEQGRGFAVVADEVRNLAQKTAASTAEIQQIIQRLQNSANGVLNVMTVNGDKAQASIERSQEATQMLEAIAQAVGQIDELNAGIAQLTQEQIGLSASIQQDTQVLQQDAQATAQGAEATARLGEQLVSTGDHLRAATAQFRV
jgi:methyl-accepting chemotaxis protein